MKAKLLALVSLASLFVLNGCNGIGNKDTIVARINDEQVFEEDFDLERKLDPSKRREVLLTDYFAEAAMVSDALTEYPELKAGWDSYLSLLDDRLLAYVYQRFYVMECFAIPEQQLRAYYDRHVDEFDKDKRFVDVRAEVAKRLFVEQNQDALRDSADGDTARFVRESMQRLRQNTIAKLVEQYPVVAEKIVPSNLEEFYEKNKEQFKTVPGYELYHIQMKDSAALAKGIRGKNLDLDSFKKLAVKMSENQETAKDSGYVGKVKKEFAMPYGIGMVKGLAEYFDGKELGTVSPVLPDLKHESFHVFFLADSLASQVKPFERARNSVLAYMENSGYMDLKPDYVLVSAQGKPVLTEHDVLTIFNGEIGFTKSNQNRERVVSDIVSNYPYAEEARHLKLNHSWEYRALVRSARKKYVLSHYRAYEQTAGFSEDSLKSYFEKNGNPVRPGLQYEESKQDLADFINFPENVLKREFYFNHVIYKNQSIDSLRKQIFSNRIDLLRNRRINRRLVDAFDKADVILYTKDVVKPMEYSLSVLQKEADSLVKAQNYEEAIQKYDAIRYTYPKDDSLFAMASFAIAQIRADQGMFEFAESEYYAYYMMWPNNPNAEKAMFSRGFILNENLNRNSAALEVLEEFLQKYPNSELKESAQWLVDNIKSNGKLADDLMKKIEAEE